MNFDYSPVNPWIWMASAGAWALVIFIVNRYRSRFHLSDEQRQDK
jgi:hypothetical protein